MTFQQLTYLLEVYKTGSFSAAAKNLIISQSAVSNAVLSLEKEVGGPIFIRGQNGLTTTAQGEDVIAHAQRICESVRHLTGNREERRRSVRICCSNFGPANVAFVRLLEENKGRTDVEFTFEGSKAGDGLKRLINYELDIVLFMNYSSYNPPSRFDVIKENGLHHEVLRYIPAAVRIGKGHPLYGAPTVKAEDLKGSKILTGSKDSISPLLRAFLPTIKSDALVVHNPETRKMLIDSGLGYQLSYLPAPQFQREGVRYIPIEGLNYIYYLVTNPKCPLCDEAKRYIELLKEELAKAYP